MSQEILFTSVAFITVASGAAATLITMRGQSPRSSAVAERLAQIALIGAGAIVALLSAAG